MLLLLLTTLGCRSLPSKDIVLPPKPQRETMPDVTSVKDVAELVNYYEHLVQEWEKWGDKVTLIVGDCK